MTQGERRVYLIKYLLAEDDEYSGIEIPADETDQKRLLRSLMNVRPAKPIGADFLSVQNDYLQEATAEKGITDFKTLTPVRDGIYIWQGDITSLRCGAIVNAANSGMTGCYQPCHSCIDNCIHTYAGVQLRLKCAEIMRRQGHPEHTGTAKITPAYNLPCEYVIHTVGPIVDGRLNERHWELLSSCYRSCMVLADEYKVGSIAFCCISTGVFGYPNEEAAVTAVETISAYRAETGSNTEVIFNVFKDKDKRIYEQLLG